MPTALSPHPVRWLLTLFVALPIWACRDQPVEPIAPDGIPATLVAVGSDVPEGVPGEPLEALPAVQVLDASGAGVPNADVTFTVLSGRGRLLGPTTVQTDAQGVGAPQGWVLGVEEGEQTLRAQAAGVTTPVDVTARSVRPPARLVNGAFLLGEGEYESGDGPPGWTTFLQGIGRTALWEVETLVLPNTTGEYRENRVEQCVPMAGTENLLLRARLASPHPHPELKVRLRGEFHPSMESCLLDEEGDGLETSISADFPLSAETAVDGAWEVATPVRWAVTRSPEARALRVGVQARDRSHEGGPDPAGRTVRVEWVSLALPTPGTGAATAMEVLTGDGQWARPGAAAPLAVQVRVMDAEGLSLPQMPVSFQLQAAGEVEQPQVETDESGIASAGLWTLGPTGGLQTLLVTVDGLDPVEVTAHAVPLPSPGTLVNGDFQLNQGAFRDGAGPPGWMVDVDSPDGVGLVEELSWSEVGSHAFRFTQPTGGFGDNRLDQCFPVDPSRGFQPVIRMGSSTPHPAAGLRMNLEFYPDEESCLGDSSNDRVKMPGTGDALRVRTDHFPWPASGVGPQQWAVAEAGAVFPGTLPSAVRFARLSIRVRDRSGGADNPSDPPIPVHLDAVELVPVLAPPPGAPTLSHPPGFYSSPIQLEALPPEDGVTLRYTLDGSLPTEESPVWDAPMVLDDRSSHEPVIARIPTAAPGISQVPTWQQPLAVKLGHAVRVRAFRPGATPGPVVSATYVVAPQGRDRYPVPVISLILDPDDLFHDERGIYVPGASFRPGDAQSGNYHGRGPGWERVAHLDFFETDGSVPFSHGVGVRIHGGHSRNLAQKSLRLYARDEYGAGTLAHPFFPDKPDLAYSRLILRSSGTDWVSTMFRDGLVHSLVEHLPFETQAYRPAVVFLNGEFWGIHNLRERYDHHYFQRVYGIPETELDYLSIDPVAREFVAEPGTTEAWDALMTLVRSLDPMDPGALDQIAARVDLESLAQNLAVHLYVANTDWPHANREIWRARNEPIPGEPLHPRDGRFRWILKDLDLSFGRPTLFLPPADANFDSIEWILRNDWSTEFYRLMMAHPAFARMLLNRIADLSNAILHPDRVIPIIDEMQARIRPLMPDHLARWRHPAGNWDDEVQKMRWFAEGRAAYIRDLHLVNHFQLEGTAVLTVDRSGGGGTVQVNSLVLDGAIPGVSSTGPWSGTYFLGVPIELRALPQPGFRFDGWEFDGGGELSAAELEELESGTGLLTLKGDLTVRARFVSGE
ncbi:MAG: CotH kinase family protein [Gemmatimonadota bacterium]